MGSGGGSVYNPPFCLSSVLTVLLTMSWQSLLRRLSNRRIFAVWIEVHAVWYDVERLSGRAVG